MRPQTRLKVGGLGVLLTGAALFGAEPVSAQARPVTHTIFMTAVETKGATTTEALLPPAVNPADLSKGYGFKAPSAADPNAPRRWEVSSYLFAPGFVTVQRGDTVSFIVFVVNGDQHEVRVVAPDGKDIVPKTTWHRGREYRVSFVAENAGPYQLICSTHAPSMLATVLVLPRPQR